MRIHSLTLQAFGAFSSTTTIDFDTLSDAGLFLLAGDTGGGKTTVLDAVCFALYGQVPGQRWKANRLRCDNAPASVRPEVSLDVTLAGRRFRVVRTPAYQRPKRRGTGTTTEQPTVTLVERVDEKWVHLSSRIDEVGLQITSLLGMNAEQFTQVAMLPQGQFSTFLHADSDKRRDLLQKLFATQRFTDIERWLADQRTLAGQRSAQAASDVQRVLIQIAEASQSEPPDTAAEATAGAFAGAQAWVDGLHADATHRVALSMARAESAADAEKAAHEHQAACQRSADRYAELRRAQTEQADLHACSDEHNAACREQEAGVRAASVSAWIDAERRSGRRLAEARRSVQLAAARVTAHKTDTALAEEALTAMIERDQAALVKVSDLLPEADRLEVLVGELSDAETAHAQTREGLGRAESEKRDLPGRIDAARKAVAAAEAAHASLPAYASQLDQLDKTIAAHAQVLTLQRELTRSAAEQVTAREARNNAKERLHALREERLTNMAAEIAGALAVGDDCPVCGSVDHPHKAIAASDAVDAQAEKAARSSLDSAEVTLHMWDDRCSTAAAELSAATALAGAGGVDDLVAERHRKRTFHAEAQGTAAKLADHQLALEALVTRNEDLGGVCIELTRSESEQRSAVERLSREISDLRSRLNEVQRQHDCESIRAVADHLLAAVESAKEALVAQRECRQAEQEYTQASAAADRARTEAGFVSAKAALEALRSEDHLAELSRGIETHRERLAITEDRLAADDAASVLQDGPPDLVGVTEQWRVAKSHLTDAVNDHRAASALAQRLDTLAAELDEALSRWQPLHAEHETIAALTRLAEGKDPSVATQTSLSAYVLSYRFTQVVDAANERLGAMTDGRFQLEYTAEKTRGERRAGLGLLVRDDWSGTTRDPRTLSGGETFMVSLALALGLADAVSHESGGIRLDTLFIDEGFGSLDADALDSVMETLDSLRSGGRVVGVVSHVEQMRAQINTRLEVSKAPAQDPAQGSTVRLVG